MCTLVSIPGEPVTEGGDFFGVAVQMAARLCSYAKPDQILVSNIVKDLCMGKELNFINEGQIELKGFSDPVSVFEVKCSEQELLISM